MTFGKASARRVVVAVAATLAFVAGSGAVTALTAEAAQPASIWPKPVPSPTPTHHGHGPS